MENKILKNKLSISINCPSKTIQGLAILCPGFLDSKDYKHLKVLAKDLAKTGYFAVRFDPTGTWTSPKEISEYTISNYLRDIKFIIDNFGKSEDSSDIVLIGHSIGGMISLLYAAQDNRITKVIDIMSPYRYVRPDRKDKQEKWKARGVRISTRDLPDNSGKRIKFHIPYSFLQDAEKYDALVAVKKINIPLFFIAGEKDMTIPADDVKTIYNHANSPKQFVLMKNIGHDYRHSREKIALINKEIIQFLKK